MTLKSRIFGAILVFGALCSQAHGALITGTFSGTIDPQGGWGVYQGIDLTSLNAQTITGSFSYDSSALRNPQLGATYFPTTPLDIIQFVGGHRFDVAGNYQSRVEQRIIDFTPKAAVLILSAIAYLPLTREVIDSTIILGTGLGDAFLQNPGDIGTLDFEHTATGGIQLFEANGLTRFSAATGGNVAGYSFRINEISAHPVPEPGVLILLMLGLATLGATKISPKGNSRGKLSSQSDKIDQNIL